MLEQLPYDDREVFWQTIDEARYDLTKRQFQCLLMQLMGYEQQDIGAVLGIDQSVVSRHWQAALRRLGELGRRYAYESPNERMY